MSKFGKTYWRSDHLFAPRQWKDDPLEAEARKPEPADETGERPERQEADRPGGKPARDRSGRRDEAL